APEYSGASRLWGQVIEQVDTRGKDAACRHTVLLHGTVGFHQRADGVGQLVATVFIKGTALACKQQRGKTTRGKRVNFAVAIGLDVHEVTVGRKVNVQDFTDVVTAHTAVEFVQHTEGLRRG